MASGGVLCVYGPFRYRGQHTSASNVEFDAWLRARDPDSAIRDFEAVDVTGAACGCTDCRPCDACQQPHPGMATTLMPLS